ncbi:hypothetical protein [Streptomyces luteocolor]|uniref:hypothetical protein n=1 Tax=Streptomyces luteocolor TaxID=285500 RepID=UPI00139061EE|nr:hypothetical protein [Streptomyces luteocolor]
MGEAGVTDGTGRPDLQEVGRRVPVPASVPVPSLGPPGASGIFRDPAALYDYIDRRIGALPGIQGVQTAPTLREVKRVAPAVR